MKISEAWLKARVPLTHSADALAEQLTMAGLEVDAVEPIHAGFSDVVVAELVEVEPHPDADKLRVCRVDAGDGGELLQIVCGAPNARKGLKSALAKVGGRLPGGMKIKKAKLRGVASTGMLCSGRELELDGDAAGIIELPADAPVGMDVAELLGLSDHVIDVDLTPNRGDCFSVLGVARELAALNDTDTTPPETSPVRATVTDTFPVKLDAPDACPRFAGRVLRGIRPDARSPLWLVERLRRAGVRSIDPVVDVTNYVMLELGQPLHAYDLAKLDGHIAVRLAAPNEKLVLLDGREIALDPDMLVIADARGPVGLAGVMGGEGTGVTDATVDVFLEGAHFAPHAIAGRARRLGLHTDASVRFERGVDPQLPALAVEYAARLILDIAGGDAGPTEVTEAVKHLPAREPVSLRRARLARLLGVTLPDAEVQRIFMRLGMAVETIDEGWRVTPPSHRFDIAIEEDLVEEVARIHGYDAIPRTPEQATMRILAATETRLPLARVRHALVDRGWQEAITYSFVDDALQQRFLPGTEAIALSNPISSEMNVMRMSLWPGLSQAAADNVARQQGRVRLFECGHCFERTADGVCEPGRVAGIALGNARPEQWDLPDRAVDFYDAKADVEALLALGGPGREARFVADSHPALHPGQSARVECDGAAVGWLGTLHPELARWLDLSGAPVVFELDLAAVQQAVVPWQQPVSRFPAVRRDLAVLVAEDMPVDAVVSCAREAAGTLLHALRVFDVYRGPKLESGSKSIALGLILQASSRTLTDADVEQCTDAVVAALQQTLGARIRD